jgi:cytochrome d ubiquinol oxidase subunit I
MIPFSDLLASTAAENLLPARLQMALTLGFHIILACFGVGLPVLLLWAEWKFLRSGDELWRTLAKRWSKAFGVLFAIGAVSGTVLSFELGLLWPNFMGKWGGVIGLPFTIEGFAFFLEAIFVGIYLYGWNRLPPRVHWLTGVPIAIAGFFSAYFVVMANSWMNTPQGFTLSEDGAVTAIDPLAAMFNPAAHAQAVHMVLGAYLVSGFSVAAFYAWKLRREQSAEITEYNRRALSLALWLALPLVPVQMVVGDWSAKVVAKTQPVKLAAMEGQFQTEKRAPLRIGGLPNVETRRTDYSVEVPAALSFLAYADFNAEVRGLDDFPRENQPPVTIVHLAFQMMVGGGSLMLIAALWGAFGFLRSRSWPTSKAFRGLIILLGPLSVLTLEAGWTVTEVGRQPWIVQGYMRTADAVTDAPGVWIVFAVTIGIYALIGSVAAVVLRQLGRQPLPSH